MIEGVKMVKIIDQKMGFSFEKGKPPKKDGTQNHKPKSFAQDTVAGVRSPWVAKRISTCEADAVRYSATMEVL